LLHQKQKLAVLPGLSGLELFGDNVKKANPLKNDKIILAMQKRKGCT